MQLLIKVLLVDFVGNEVRIHGDIVLEVTDIATRNVFNNRICELKKYAIHTVNVYMHIICQLVVSVTRRRIEP